MGSFVMYASPMSRLPSYDEPPAGLTGQADRGQASWGQGNLVAADGELCTASDGAGGQGNLQDRVASQRC